MKNKTIKFNSPAIGVLPALSPWSSGPKEPYKDLILKPEFKDRRYKFPMGQTWFRVVPALPTSSKGWMLGVHALQYSKGRHAHPKTITSGDKSVYDHAYAWLKSNSPHDLFSKSNKAGYRLLPDPICLCWILIEQDGKMVSRLLLASGYDGSRGGAPGLGHQIFQLCREEDEDGNRIGNPADPESGTQLCVEKVQPPGASYPRYTLKRGRVTAPISDMIAGMDPSEVDALTPLEDVIHVPDPEEEWSLLENVIDPATCGKIRAAVD